MSVAWALSAAGPDGSPLSGMTSKDFPGIHLYRTSGENLPALCTIEELAERAAESCPVKTKEPSRRLSQEPTFDEEELAHISAT